MYWHSDTKPVSNVARGDKRVAHPCGRLNNNGKKIFSKNLKNTAHSFKTSKYKRTIFQISSCFQS